MKRIPFLALIVLLASTLLLSTCKKDDNTSSDLQQNPWKKQWITVADNATGKGVPGQIIDCYAIKSNNSSLPSDENVSGHKQYITDSSGKFFLDFEGYTNLQEILIQYPYTENGKQYNSRGNYEYNAMKIYEAGGVMTIIPFAWIQYNFIDHPDSNKYIGLQFSASGEGVNYPMGCAKGGQPCQTVFRKGKSLYEKNETTWWMHEITWIINQQTYSKPERFYNRPPKGWDTVVVNIVY